jgi:hypothetical protein
VGNIYLKPISNSEVVSQILYGEKFKVLSKKKNWLQIKTYYDNYIGYIRIDKFLKTFKPTNKIFKLESRIFKRRGKKFFQTENFLFFGSGVSVINKNKNFLEFEKNRWIKKIDAKKIDHFEKNFIKILKLFLNTKYLWGGKTSRGIDCSALIQNFFYYNRIFFPRDSKDQMRYCKKKLNKELIKGKIIFWKGHVAYKFNKNELIHAYGPKKRVLLMNVNKTIEKIFNDTGLKPIYI